MEDKILRLHHVASMNLQTITPLSLGWNCNPAIFRGNQLKFLKSNGYLTCPFDLCVTPFEGLCQVLLDDFDETKFFNLRVEYDPYNKQDCILNEYNMWFNHEAEETKDPVVALQPGKWKENDYALFRERYAARIQNFKSYVNTAQEVVFIMVDSHPQLTRILLNVLKFKYPRLNYKVLLLDNDQRVFLDQHLHSPGFPSVNDTTFLPNLCMKFKQFDC